MSTGFDRVRPRVARSTDAASPSGVDAEGKRALFTSASDVDQPGIGSALVECSRCNARTVLRPMKAIRAMLPSVHLGIRVGHGEDVRELAVLKRDYPTYMRCPDCGRPSWVRLTVQL